MINHTINLINRIHHLYEREKLFGSLQLQINAQSPLSRKWWILLIKFSNLRLLNNHLKLGSMHLLYGMRVLNNYSLYDYIAAAV
jgi:hypothetical protein